MIVSHRHRFIFLHCRKMGGSSMTRYLNRFLGPRDVQIGLWKDTDRAAGEGFNLRFLTGALRYKYGLGVAEATVNGAIRRRRPDLIRPHRKFH